jgi:hypothetical protein
LTVTLENLPPYRGRQCPPSRVVVCQIHGHIGREGLVKLSWTQCVWQRASKSRSPALPLEVSCDAALPTLACPTRDLQHASWSRSRPAARNVSCTSAIVIAASGVRDCRLSDPLRLKKARHDGRLCLSGVSGQTHYCHHASLLKYSMKQVNCA